MARRRGKSDDARGVSLSKADRDRLAELAAWMRARALFASRPEMVGVLVGLVAAWDDAEAKS